LTAYKDSNGFLVYETTPYDIELAEEEFNKRFQNNLSLNQKTVYNRRESRIAGILGEIVFQKMFPDAKKSPPKDITYDFILKGKKIDVKCKYRKVPPKSNFEASFFSYQGADYFDVDLYVFMSTMGNLEKVWVCGYVSKNSFLNNPLKKLWIAGEVDSRNGMKFIKDTLCLPYSELRRFN
jgi:hypothetical protein